MNFRKTFCHHTPSSNCTAKIKVLRQSFSDMADMIDSLLVLACREKSVAHTKLEEACMWAIKGIVLNDPESKLEDV